MDNTLHYEARDRKIDDMTSLFGVHSCYATFYTMQQLRCMCTPIYMVFLPFLLTLKAPNKNCSRRHFLFPFFFFYFYLSKEIRLGVSCESSA